MCLNIEGTKKIDKSWWNKKSSSKQISANHSQKMVRLTDD